MFVHVLSGVVSVWLSRQRVHQAAERDSVVAAATITIERATPRPTPSATPTPTPPPTPTPLPRPSAAPALPRLATMPRLIPTPRVLAAQIARHEIARVRVRASPQPPPVPPARGTYTSGQLASLNGQFRQTIASAQRAVAEGPARTGGSGAGTAPAMKRYDAVLSGSPADQLGGGGVCDNLSEETRGAYTYIYWQCRVRYSDGFTETVAFPWPFVYPRGGTPRPNQSFPAQPPPSSFHLGQVFALSRQVCYYFRDRCDAVLARERAAGAPDYGTPP